MNRKIINLLYSKKKIGFESYKSHRWKQSLFRIYGSYLIKCRKNGNNVLCFETETDVWKATFQIEQSNFSQKTYR